MYCSKCGTENQQDARFCCKCGTELNSVNVVANQNSNVPMVDQAYINQIGEIALNLQQLDDIEDKLSDIKTDLDKAHNSLLNHQKTANNTEITFLSIIVLIGILVSIIFSLLIVGYLYMASLIKEMGNGYFFVSVVVAVIIDVILYKPIKNSFKKDQSKLRTRLEEKYNNLKNEYEQVEMQKEQVIDSLSKEINIIPPNYRYLLAVQYIFDSFVNMRARNMTEAINLYEEQLHRWKIENAQQQMLVLSRQQATAAQINMAANVANAAHNIFS